MKKGESISPGQPDRADLSGKLSYQVSRKPKNKNENLFPTIGAALKTPSGARVSPGWTDIWMTNNPKSPIQAIGKDAKGRRVYLYSAEHMGMATAAKFSRLKAFIKQYPSLIKRVRRDMKTSEDAIVLYLIAKTGFRIGSNAETRASVKAFGASTLRCSQISVKGDRLSFDFIGKKGIRVNKVLKDAHLARIIAGRCSGEADDKIFMTTDDEIRAYLNSISKGLGFKVKDFRTYMGTMKAFQKIKMMPIPQNGTEFKIYKKEVGKTVARELGNSPNIALNSYVSPEVFCVWDLNSPFPKTKIGRKRSSFADDFLECIHYDQAVSIEDNTDSELQNDPDNED